MRQDFNIDHLRQILASCPEYETGHHLDRPFMSVYQIAIRFAEVYPNHNLVRTFPVGGEGTGVNQSLARFLSQAIRDGTAEDIDGGFISHACVDDFTFHHRCRRVRVSTLRTAPAHSIFRVRRAASDQPS